MASGTPGEEPSMWIGVLGRTWASARRNGACPTPPTPDDNDDHDRPSLIGAQAARGWHRLGPHGPRDTRETPRRHQEARTTSELPTCVVPFGPARRLGPRCGVRVETGLDGWPIDPCAPGRAPSADLGCKIYQSRGGAPLMRRVRRDLILASSPSSHQLYLVSSSCRYPPGGGPTSTPSTSTHACASLSFGSRGSPTTNSGRSPCSCSRRNKMSDVYKHRARQVPTRSTLETILPRRRGSTCVDDIRRGCFNRSTTTGSGRRLTSSAIQAKRPHVWKASAPFRWSGSRFAASFMTLPSTARASSRLRRASICGQPVGPQRSVDDGLHDPQRAT